ncbi:type II secretion system minor pseudopilin GspI [Roseateles amylovorans]|uniref:Type II secretion system protein I n=1 Tax=Roseateles amylovorans TaxID=2978473 RepID=A0ABY6B7P6_9BURK|nr:type II secretion system minor pseudopilin GspI [Roseateles amylovorans]UXH80976.1 type II secretion system minor pseudopilin GspI [Roseateles amylovorans]
MRAESPRRPPGSTHASVALPRSTGFTLIEVLIALAIISVSLAAFVRLTSQTTTQVGLLDARSLAMLSAQNSLHELRMDDTLPVGVRQVPCPQADQRLVCRVEIGANQNGIRTVSVSVHSDTHGEPALARLQTRMVERRP